LGFCGAALSGSVAGLSDPGVADELDASDDVDDGASVVAETVPAGDDNDASGATRGPAFTPVQAANRVTIMAAPIAGGKRRFITGDLPIGCLGRSYGLALLRTRHRC
jgi:hypothetical protein